VGAPIEDGSGLPCVHLSDTELGGDMAKKKSKKDDKKKSKKKDSKKKSKKGKKNKKK
jgi:hypothetical protein